MSFPRYPKYKPSGVEWLKDVPEHWEVKPLCGCASERCESNKGMIEDNLLSLSYGRIVQKDMSSNDGLLPESFETYQIVRRGDIVFRLTDLQNDKRSLRSAMVEEDGIITSAYLAVKPESAGSRFLAHLFRAYDATKVFYSMGGGLRQSMKYADVKRLPTLLPPPGEQTAIAAFLDRETAMIDGLVAEQRRLLELLKEKRQAVISNAVTKGLNPRAPMKPSGIEWLGDVPEHWAVERGRFLFRKLDTPPEPEDGVVTAFRDGQVTLRENRRTEGFTLAFLEVGYQRVRAGDLVIHGMDAFAGAIGVSESTGKCTPEYSVMTPARPGIDNRYFARILRLMAQRNYIFVICPSVRERAPRFRFEAFKDIPLPVPPLEEQQKIIHLIESVSAETITLAAEAQRAIDLLQERRTALISATVTGQIDVRNAADIKTA